MRYNADKAGYVSVFLTALGLGGCEKQPSQLETTVSAQVVPKAEELDLSTPEKAGDAYLAAYDDADYDKLLRMTTGDLHSAFKKGVREEVIKELRESLKNSTATENIVNRVIVHGPATKDKVLKVRELKKNEAEIQYFFNGRFGGFDGNGKLNRWTLRLRNVGDSWFVYDQ